LEVAGRKIAELHRAAASGLSICRLIAEMTDRLLIGVWGELVAELDSPRPIALLALGGYGRRELAPHSDLDLLMLPSHRVPQRELEPLSRIFSTFLWDLQRVPGWSVRNPAESVKAAEDDHTIRTALLDCRFLAGDQRVFQTLSDQLLRELLSHRGSQFIADKAEEVRLRREKYGDSVFVLEPDIKQSEGGLRDLQAALWIAQARFRVRGLGGLLKQSILSGSQVQLLRAARDFLLRIRNELHYTQGRKEDRLTFELQEHVAHFLGYADGPQGLFVEQFMRHYYLCAKAIRRAADLLIARCEEEPSRGRPYLVRRLGPFKVFSGKLTLEGNPDLLSEQPATVLRLFRVADEESLSIYGWAQDQVIRALPKLEEARGDVEVVDALKHLVGRAGTRGQFLFPMHELGVLGAVLPEFARVTAHHQHDLYHVYTVDVHSLFALRRLYELRAGDLVEKEPELSRLMRDLEDPLPLYLGMLFHDAAKGLGGNHSIRGKELISRAAERLRLTAAQRELAEFLVLEHLSMSRTAQRRDLSDPQLISDFAASVGAVEKLTCLYLLTYADISSVGPEMWNDWKARLLSELYEKTRSVLLQGAGQGGPDGSAAIERPFIARWTEALGESRAKALRDSMPRRYFSGSDPKSAVFHARLLDRARRMLLVSAMRQRRQAGFSELTVCTRDQPGLLASVTGVFSAHSLDILRARINSTLDGWALDVFDVWAPQGRLVERRRWKAAQADLVAVLNGAQSVQQVLRRRRPNPLFLRRLPPVETRVSMDNRVSQQFSVIDIRAQDRVGLLHCIASFLAAQRLEISFASVATEAHRALDSFYVTLNGQKVTEVLEVEAITAGLRRAIDALEVDGGGDGMLASKQPHP